MSVSMVEVDGVLVRADELDSYLDLLDTRTATAEDGDVGGLPCPVCGSTFTAQAERIRSSTNRFGSGHDVGIICPADGYQRVPLPRGDPPPPKLRRTT